MVRGELCKDCEDCENLISYNYTFIDCKAEPSILWFSLNQASKNCNFFKKKDERIALKTPMLEDKIWKVNNNLWAQESRDVVCLLDTGEYVVDRRLRNFDKLDKDTECWKRGLDEVVSWSEINYQR